MSSSHVPENCGCCKRASAAPCLVVSHSGHRSGYVCPARGVWQVVFLDRLPGVVRALGASAGPLVSNSSG